MARIRLYGAGVALGALLAAGIPAVSHAEEGPPSEVFVPAAINRDARETTVDTSWGESMADLYRGDASNDGDDARRVPVYSEPENNYTIGDVPWAATEEFALWDGATANVNLDSGNLLLSVTDWESTAPGIAPRLTRFHNSLSDRTGGYIGNWTLGVGGDVGYGHDRLDGTSTKSTFFAPSGYTANLFTNTNVDPAAEVPEGLNISATGDQYGFIDEITWNRSGNRMNLVGAGAEGWLAEETDRNGIGTTYTYPSETAFDMTDAGGRTSTFDANDSYAEFETFDGRRWDYKLAGDTLASVGGPRGFQQDYEYDDAGRLTFARVAVADGQGPEPALSVEYDDQGRVAALAQGSWNDTDGVFEETMRSTFFYEADQTEVTDARGNTATYVLDGQGRQIEAIDANGNSRTQEWTANSDIAEATDALTGGANGGNTATYSYDELNNATGYTLPTGAAASAAYAQGVDCPNAGSGNQYLAKCATDTDGNITEYEYDEAGNRTTETGDGGAVTKEYVYEASDRGVCGGFAGQICSATDGNGNLTSYTYNDNGDLAQVTPPAPQGTSTYEYDGASRLTSVTDGNGDTTSYMYDALDRPVVTDFADGSTTLSMHGPQGALLQTRFISDTTTQRVNYTYDGLLRETSKSVSGPAPAEYAQSYDAAGNVVSYSGPGGITAATYDAANQLVALTEPGGACGEGAPGPGSKCVKFEYDGNGAETLRTFPGGATQQTVRDGAGRPTQIIAKDAVGATHVDIGYTYTLEGEDTGSIQTRTSNAEEGIEAGAVTTYAYDALSRVTGATEKVGEDVSASWAYSYDAAGNRTEQITAGNTGTAAGTVSYEYDAANRLVSTSLDESDWAYDAAGNLTQNGMTGETATFGARGEVTSKGGTNFTSVNQGNTETLADSTGDSFLRSSLGLMTRGNAAGATNYLIDNTGGVVGFAANASHYYAMDHLGSVVGLFSANGAWEGGYSYSPYGEERATADTTPAQANQLRYIGGEIEEDGTYRFGARYYDPAVGRFTQMDPSGQEANPYSYATCDPINASDPTGLNTLLCFASALVAIGGTVKLIADVIGAAGLLLVPEPSITKLAATVLALGIAGDIAIVTGGVIAALYTCR